MTNSREDIEKIIKSDSFQRYVENRKITYLGLFGSFSKGKVRIDSDIDLLISFGEPIGLIESVKIDEDLEKFFGRKVDVINPKFINKRIRKYILKDKIDYIGTFEIKSI